MRRLRMGLALAISAALLPNQGASAALGCSVVGTTLAVDLLTPIEPTRIVVSDAVSPSEIEVWIRDVKQACGAPTVMSVDAIVVADFSPGSSILTIDLSGGPFAPGVTEPVDSDNPSGPAEIEMTVDMGIGSNDELVIEGTDAADHFVLGGDGVNLNAGDETTAGDHDADLATAGVEILTVRAGDGADEVDATGLDGLDPFGGRLHAFGGAGIDALTGGTAADLLDGGADADVLVGGEGSDELRGGAGVDDLDGEGGDDRLAGGPDPDVEDGGSGDDVFDQGSDPDGADVLTGGDGLVDIVAYDLRDDSVIASLDGTPGSGEAGEGDTLGTDIEGILGGSADDTLTGGGSADLLRGRSGDDTIAGGSGDDTVAGGSGDDTIDGGAGRDLADFFTAGGPVQADLAAGSATGQGTDTLVAVEDLGGTQFDDSLSGDDGPNRLVGQGGDDILSARGGADELLGGAGADMLAGDAGDDVLDGGANADTADFRSSPAAVHADLLLGTASGQGGDLLFAIEHLRGGRRGDTLIGNGRANRLVGGGGNDRLVGRAGRDRFLGGNGRDRMLGGPGKDLFIEGRRASGADRMLGGPGRDLVSYARRTGSVRVTLAGRRDDGEANERDKVGPGIEQARGGRSGDVLVGNGAPNRLIGGPGGDDLDGRARNDVLIGGAGNDLLDGSRGRDRCRGQGGRNRLVRCER